MVEFPIQTKTSCPLKWVWSTLFLNSGTTRSCHRTAESLLTKDNFLSFHNTPIKVQDRLSMLQGDWPDKNCTYCKDIEDAGGVSDRIRHTTVPHVIPEELKTDPAAVNISPTLLEVYFNNTCNLGCLYCIPALSSTIAAENLRHGKFQNKNVLLENPPMHFKNLVPEFWQWFPTGFPKLSRLQIAGGEPFYQTEFDRLLDMIEQYPNPKCELNIVTNLMVPESRLSGYIEKFTNLLSRRRVRRIDITCSIDCWGPQQEYVRWGINLEQWKKNFESLISVPYFYLNINQTVSVLTIKTMPELLDHLQTWRKKHAIGHWFSEVNPGPDYLKPHILGNEIFAQDFDEILRLMPKDSEENIKAREYMSGIFTRISKHDAIPNLINDLFIFLNEKDRRRNTNWRTVFPWLTAYENCVV